jgi:hypothetical protein
MSASNAAYAEQFTGSNWDIPAHQSLQRATGNTQAERSVFSRVSTGIFGSEHFYNNESLIKIVSLNEAMKPAFGDPLSESYVYVNTFVPNQGMEQTQWERGLLIDRIQKDYVLEDRVKVRSFLEDRPSLPQILLEAVAHLKESFGTNVTLQLQVPLEEEVPASIYAVVLWTGGLQEARAALQRFDDSWWRESSKKASGRIVFDYQLV